MAKKQKPLISAGQDWSWEVMEKIEKEIRKIALDELQLDVYKNQIEIVTAEQMLDAYSSVGMPIYYNHWSFGKDFMSNQRQYEAGRMGLAFEIVINSNPCVSACMDSNTAMMQALVIAHAGYGHNAVFKNNYLFKQWTDAGSIVEYLNFAKKYMKSCEEKYGYDEVESVVDSCHALAQLGVDKVTRNYTPTLKTEEEEQRAFAAFDEKLRSYNELWDKTVPKAKKRENNSNITEPEDNILYFIEKNAPTLPAWKREIIRIVRKINQYFYPQGLTKVLNEGFATFTHFYIMNRLWEKGFIDAGAYQEFLHSHTGVVYQPEYDSPYFSGGFNPYALGFEMFRDIKRMCENPTEEDKQWFPDIVNTNWVDTVKYAMENFNDSSFIAQFLSPRLMRHFKMFAISDREDSVAYEITAIHDEDGYYKIRKDLSDSYLRSVYVPDIQVVDVDIHGSRTLHLRHNISNIPLNTTMAEKTGMHVVNLWEQPVVLESVDCDGKYDFKIHFKGKYE